MRGHVSTCQVRTVVGLRTRFVRASNRADTVGALPRRGASRLSRWGLGLSIMLAFAACENKRTQLTQEEIENGVRTRSAPTSSTKAVDPKCALSEKVTAPAQGSPEWVIQEIYTAATATGDDEANFQRFYKQFDATQTAESWARSQYWGRVKQHVAKYVDNPGGSPAHYTLCERRVEGPETTRFSIRSNDPAKMNPPITVRKDATGQNRVVFFSY